MEDMDLIHLVTPDRKISVTVLEHDPHYSTFFSSVREIEGVLPNVIEVPSYVLAQHDAWLRLLQWIELTPTLFYQGIIFYKVYDEKDPAELRTLVPPTVFLAEVNIIIGYLLDAPSDWMRFVAVDERSTFQERADYYRSVGRIVRSDERLESHYVSGTWPYRLYRDFQLTEDPIRRRNQPHSIDIDTANRVPLSPEDFERLINVDWMNILQGARHSALVQSIGRRDRIISHPENGEVDWLLIIWSDILALVHVDWTLRPTFDLSEPTVLPPGDFLLPYAYAGMRVPHAPVQHGVASHGLQTTGRINFQLRSSRASIQSPIRIAVTHFNVLYNRAMAALTGQDNVSVYDPVRLGLSVLLSKGKYRDINKLVGAEIVPKTRAPHWAFENDIYGLLPVLHLTVLLQAPRSRVGIMECYNNITLEENDFPAAIQIVKSTLGTRALTTFVATLIHYVPHDDKALKFCELAIDAIGDGPFVRLPK